VGNLISGNLDDVEARMVQAATEAAAKEAAHQAECKEEIGISYTNIVKNQEEYDKQLLTLSAGYLVLSMSFIKDIVHLDQSVSRGLLYASFILLAACTILVLLSYQISNQGQYAAKEYWEDQKGKDRKMAFPYGYAQLIRVMNWGTGILFCAGIVSSVAFVIVNLHHQAAMANQVLINATSGPKTIPPPPPTKPPGAPLKEPEKKPPPKG